MVSTLLPLIVKHREEVKSWAARSGATKLFEVLAGNIPVQPRHVLDVPVELRGDLCSFLQQREYGTAVSLKVVGIAETTQHQALKTMHQIQDPSHVLRDIANALGLLDKTLFTEADLQLVNKALRSGRSFITYARENALKPADQRVTISQEAVNQVFEFTNELDSALQEKLDSLA